MMKNVILILTVLTMSVNSNAQTSPLQNTVSVTGEGVVQVIPDEVIIRVRVENTGKNVAEIKRLNDQAINDVLAFCRKMKIDKKDVLTQRINLNKNYDYHKKTTNYVANQTLSIRVRDLSKYEPLMLGLLEAGVNRIDGVQFKTSKMEALKSEARIKAMKNAKFKATEYASAVNQQIGKAITIMESGVLPQPPMPVYKMAMVNESSADMGRMETIAVGEIEIKSTVSVVFELK